MKKMSTKSKRPSPAYKPKKNTKHSEEAFAIRFTDFPRFELHSMRRDRRDLLERRKMDKGWYKNSKIVKVRITEL